MPIFQIGLVEEVKEDIHSSDIKIRKDGETTIQSSNGKLLWG